MLKKMMLLAGMALALVAFAAPAIAQADEWVTDDTGDTIGNSTAEADEVEFTGSLASTSGPVQSGPCQVHALVDVWNEEGSATAEVTNFTITTHCPVTSPLPIIPPGCTLAKASSEGFPWHTHINNETGVAITGAHFKNTYAGCSPPLPESVTAVGTATGQFVNRTTGETTEGCIVFNNSGDLQTVPGGGNVFIDGEVCAPHLTLV
jgi:hypothetical protein